MPDGSSPSKSRARRFRNIRRSFLRTSAVVTAGLAALAASLKPLLEMNDFPTVERFMQKYYKEMTPDDMAKVLKRIENEVEKQYGIRPHVRDLKPMDGVAVRLLPQPDALHRLPQMRPRLRRGEQPVAQSRDPVHPRAADAARLARHRQGRAQLRPGVGAGEGLLLHAGAVPAVQEPALREGLPGPRHLAGDRRHHRDRLRLVHRLPLLRGRLPLLGAALQLHQARRFRRTGSTRTWPTSATARAGRA